LYILYANHFLTTLSRYTQKKPKNQKPKTNFGGGFLTKLVFVFLFYCAVAYELISELVFGFWFFGFFYRAHFN